MMLAANPFISSYIQSDWFGRGIFLGLFATSMMVWSVLIYKGWIYFVVKRRSSEFSALFSEKDPLSVQVTRPVKGGILEIPHPFFEIYKVFKQTTLELIGRNHMPTQDPVFSEADLTFLEGQLQGAINAQFQKLDKNLFLLSTAVTLSPFLGLLGTVWGILVTFSELHTKGVALSNTSMLSGLSLALATTVVGLVVAIPALIGNNVLKNRGRDYLYEMEGFASGLLAKIELQYRKPKNAEKLVSTYT